ncbi:MAG: PKD domain-containing protein [Eudoraea sp.]|nr:PKD domain-containing protein [Eudoraea sp.]
MKHNYLLILCCFLFYSCSTDEIEKETPDPGEALEACFEISEETLMVGESLKLFSCSSGATTFLYDFGNGDASTLENPEITFTESGEYTITLTVGNDEGETKTYSLEITVVSVEGFYVYPDIAEGYSAIPLEMSVNPDNGKIYYIELLVDEVGSGGSKFYYRELAENYETEGQ